MLVLHPEVRLTLTHAGAPPEFVNEYLSYRRVWPGVDVPGQPFGLAQTLATLSRNRREPVQLRSPAAMLPETVVIGAVQVGRLNGRTAVPLAEVTVRAKSIGASHRKQGAVLASKKTRLVPLPEEGTSG